MLRIKRNGSFSLADCLFPSAIQKSLPVAQLEFFLSHLESSECHPVPTLEIFCCLWITSVAVMIIAACLLLCLSTMPLAWITPRT